MTRLDDALRDNQARNRIRELRAILPFAIPEDAYRSSAQVVEQERLIAEQRHNFTGHVSRTRWTADMRPEAIATLQRYAVIAEPVVLIAIPPADFLALAFPDGSFLRDASALVATVPYFAVAAQESQGLLLFEWTWTAPPEGTWGELATFSTFRQLPELREEDWFEVEDGGGDFLARLREQARRWPALPGTTAEDTFGWQRSEGLITYADVVDHARHRVTASYRVDYDGERVLAARVSGEHVDQWSLFGPTLPEGDDPVELARGGPVECADAAAAWYLERLSPARPPVLTPQESGPYEALRAELAADREALAAAPAAWLRWWDARGGIELRMLLMSAWDPVGVNDASSAWDEYDDYLPAVANALRSTTGADARTDAVAACLHHVEREFMGRTTEPNRYVAQLIVAWYAWSMPAR